MKQTVMTLNLRVHTPIDGENAWPNRVQSVAEVFRTHAPLIVGTQEGLASMLTDLQTHLPEYTWLGQGRDEQADSEHCAIFYRKDAMTVMESGQFWLSETPNRPSSSWNSACPRICTWAVLAMKDEPRSPIAVYNTHLDHISEDAREQGAKQIWTFLEQQRAISPLPAVVFGDMNAETHSRVIRFFRGQDEIDGTMANLFDLSETLPAGIGPTYHGFGRESPLSIDYILVTPGVETSQVRVDRSLYDGRHPSDHYPVLAELEWTHL